MADLEAVLADVSYLMAMEKSKSAPAARASKKIVLPDPRYVFLARIVSDIDLPFYWEASTSRNGRLIINPRRWTFVLSDADFCFSSF